MEIKTPELEKIAKVKEQSQTIGEFLDWLSQNGYVIAEWRFDEDEDQDVLQEAEFYEGEFGWLETLLAKFYHIDLNKAQAEREDIYLDLKRRNELKRGER